MKKTAIKVEDVEKQLNQLNGNMAAVARTLGVHRSTIKRFVDKRPKLLEVASDLRESMKDNAESALYSAILEGQPWAVQFFLRTQAKDRGYVERSEHEHSGEVRQRVIEEVIDDSGDRHDNPAAPSAESVPPE